MSTILLDNYLHTAPPMSDESSLSLSASYSSHNISSAEGKPSNFGPSVCSGSNGA